MIFLFQNWGIFKPKKFLKCQIDSLLFKEKPLPRKIDKYKHKLGPNEFIEKDKYVFVYQDVRGRYMSEGEFENVRPICQNTINCTDESTDTFDSIEWLIKNLDKYCEPKVGMWGISYGGFYSMMGLINSHPALKCSSPQAPILDWFMGDDFHHNGALFLPDFFNFIKDFGIKRDTLTNKKSEGYKHVNKNGLTFFSKLHPLDKVNSTLLNLKVPFWDSLCAHPEYDH